MADALTTLATGEARTLATTTKTVPQSAGTSPRWLLRVLPWIDVPGGVYRRTSTLRRTLPRRGSDQPGVVVHAGHQGETTLTGMYIEYGEPAREYDLSVSQTVMRVHTRVTDLYSDPIDQYEQQLRLTLDALTERREHELVNSREFGLVHTPPPRHRLETRHGAPTPADLDALICKQTSPRFLLAHPKAIAAFSQQCNKWGVSPEEVEFEGRQLLGWRGLPFLPCDKLPIAADRTTSILVIRPDERRQGVVGLRPITDQRHPGVTVHKLGTDDKATTSYLISDYFSLTALIPNAVCALDSVQL